MGLLRGTEYEMSPSDRKERGTTVTLYLAEDALEFLDEYRLREIIEKYCAFMPVEIFWPMSIPRKRNMTKKGNPNQ